MPDRLTRKLLRQQLLRTNPQALYGLVVELQDALEYRLELAKGDTGDTGPMGPQGPKGDSIRGPKGDRGETGKDGRDGKDGKPGRDGIDGRDGRDGKDGTANLEPFRSELESLKKRVIEQLTLDEIIDGINKRKGNKRIDASAISNLPLLQPIKGQKNPKKIDFSDLRWHGGGDAQTALTGLYTEIPSGAIDGVNVTYTVTSTIHSVINFTINGEFISPNQYSFSGNVITFYVPIDGSLSGSPFYITYA